MKPKRVILCPNPYRDSELKVCKQSRDMLESLGMQTSVCLPFQREGYGEELGIPMRLLQQEIRSADLLIAFGGDGTILHLARTVALHSVPVLGVNLGSLGFMSELEVNELDRLRDLAEGRFTVESRMMLDASVLREGRQVYSNIALNDAVISKGSIARVVRLDIFTEEGRLTRVGGDGIIVSTPTGLHRIFYGRRRPHCGAHRQKPAADPDMSPFHPLVLLRAVTRPCDHRGSCGCQPEIRLSFRRRRQSVFFEKRRPGAGEHLKIHHKAGSSLQKELLRNTGQKNGNGGF